MVQRQRQLTPTERSSLIGFQLARGKTVTLSSIQYEFGMCESGAYRLLIRLSRVLPLVNIDGVWQIMEGV